MERRKEEHERVQTHPGFILKMETTGIVCVGERREEGEGKKAEKEKYCMYATSIN